MPDGGAYGLAVVDEIEGGICVLTAAHVAGALSSAGPGSHEVFASDIGCNRELGWYLGRVRRSVPAVYQSASPVDAALIEVSVELELTNDIRGGVAPKVERDLLANPPDEPIQVWKQGPVTGLTEGLLDPVVAEVMTHDPLSPVPPVLLTHGFWVYSDEKVFATRGDSGSIVVDRNDQVVGMVVAIGLDPVDERPRAFCQAFSTIRSALRVGIASV